MGASEFSEAMTGMPSGVIVEDRCSENMRLPDLNSNQTSPARFAAQLRHGRLLLQAEPESSQAVAQVT